MTDKQAIMELDSRERKQRHYNTFLTAFVAVTFTVAILEGAGLILFYTHFQGANAVMEARIAAIEARELAASTVEMVTESSTGETPPTHVNQYPSFIDLLHHLHCTLMHTLIHTCTLQCTHSIIACPLCLNTTLWVSS